MDPRNLRQRDPLNLRLRKLARRLAFQQWLRLCVSSLFITVSAAALWVVVTRLFPVLGDARPVAFGVIGLGAVVATLLAFVRRPTLVQSALEADKKLGLRERLTSSLELADTDGPMVEALHADARRKLEKLDFRGQFPLAANRAMRWVYAPLIAFAVLYLFLPEYDLLRHREKTAEAKAKDDSVQVHVERLQAAIKPLDNASAEDASIIADIEGLIDRLAADMKSGTLSEKQALAKLSNLSDKLQEHRDGLASRNPRPKVLSDPKKLGMAADLASALQKGNMSEAAQKAQELAQKMKEGKLSEEEKEELSKHLSELAKMLGGANSELGQALAKALAQAGEALKNGDSDALDAAMMEVQLSLEDLESILQQLEQLDTVMASLSEWQNDLLGPSDYCRFCGTKLTECKNGSQCTEHDHDHSCVGVCGSCSGGRGGGYGPGMGGAGRGRGNRVGELPETMAGFQPSMTGGPLTKGRMLADILQKAAPDGDVTPTVQNLSGAFVQLQQKAEQALTQQEIPRGSKEFVRQYFGSIEPEKDEGPLKQDGRASSR